MKILSQTLLLLFLSTQLSAEVVNRIILRVNDRIATLYDYQQLRAERLREIMRQANLSEEDRQRYLEESGQRVMREIFDELLILSRADQLAVAVSEVEVDEAMAIMRERSNLQRDEDFQLALAQSGTTLEALRRQMRQRLMFDEVMAREVSPRINLEEEELRSQYRENAERFRVPEQVQVKELVVLEEASSGAEDLASLADKIRAEIVAGQDLDEIAGRYQGRVSAVVDVGWVEPGDLDPLLEEAVWDLQVGDVSEPIAARGGLHLCRVLGRRESSIRPFEEVQEQILRWERQKRFEVEVQGYLKELEEQSFIRGSVPPEAEGFQTATGRSLADGGIALLEAPSRAEADDALKAAGQEKLPEPEEEEGEGTPP